MSTNGKNHTETKICWLATFSLCLALLPLLVLVVWQEPVPVIQTLVFISLTETLSIVTGVTALLIIKRSKETLRGKRVAILAIAFSIIFLLHSFLSGYLVRLASRM